MADDAVDAVFTKRLPKVELHAHLTGSISVAAMHEIWQQRKDSDETFSLEDPVIAMPPEQTHNVFTFFPLFDSYIYQLCSSAEAVRYTTDSVLRDFQADGVRYLELRTTPRENASAGLTKELYVTTVLDCIRDFGARDQMSTYLILSVDRRNTPEQAMEAVQLAMRHRHRGVVGVDLCGNPTKGDVSTFRAAFEAARAAGLKVTLHFAEAPQSSSEQELRTLLDYRPDRLGHVIHVPPAVKDEIAKRRLGLELCLSCNVKANLTPGGFAGHHFGFWTSTDCPISLCTDDVGIFLSPVSNEYLLAAQHFGLGRHQLVDISRRAVDSIFAGYEEKERMLHLLDEFQKTI